MNGKERVFEACVFRSHSILHLESRAELVGILDCFEVDYGIVCRLSEKDGESAGVGKGQYREEEAIGVG